MPNGGFPFEDVVGLQIKSKSAIRVIKFRSRSTSKASQSTFSFLELRLSSRDWHWGWDMTAGNTEPALVSNVGQSNGGAIRSGVSVVSTSNEHISGVVSVADRLGVVGESLAVSGQVVELVGTVWVVDFGLGDDWDVVLREGGSSQHDGGEDDECGLHGGGSGC